MLKKLLTTPFTKLQVVSYNCRLSYSAIIGTTVFEVFEIKEQGLHFFIYSTKAATDRLASFL